MSDVKPRAEHFPLPAWEVVVDLLVHGDLDGHGLAHEVLGQLPAVVRAEALEHEAGVLHRVLEGHASSFQSSCGLGKGLTVLVANIPCVGCFSRIRSENILNFLERLLHCV